jgi:hypothetical protein
VRTEERFRAAGRGTRLSDKVQIGGSAMLLLGGVYAFGASSGRLKAAEAQLWESVIAQASK